MSNSIVPILVFGIPILGMVLKARYRWQELDAKRWVRDRETQRRFALLDDVDRRVTDIERYVTSGSHELDRQFGQLATTPPKQG